MYDAYLLPVAILVNSLVIRGPLIKKAEKTCGVATSLKWQTC